MNEPLTIVIAGDIAEWLEQEANHNTRTPAQHVTHILQKRKEALERDKQRREERMERRKALGFASRGRAAA